jgi:pimeloyl-ACP methyl ester carboxylesterase
MLTDDFFDSDGVRLHYIDWGGSGPPLVLLAGLGGTAHLYRGLAPRLAERFRVVGLTRRGHGQSDRPDFGYDIDTLVEDIRRFMDRLGLDRAVLGGHSWAGMEIPAFAARYRNRVAAAVYFDAVNVLLEPAPDAASDPVWAVLQTQPSAEDVASPDAYIAYLKRSRPDLASIWCGAIEADRLEDLPRVQVDYALPLGERRSYRVTQQMNDGLGSRRNPSYGDVKAPQLAFVPVGAVHPFLPSDASDELVRAANAYRAKHWLPWINRRTALFRQAAPDACIIELDTSNHTIFVAKENAVVETIFEFLANTR